MELMDTLNKIRKPIYRSISDEAIPTTSSLKQLELKGELTKAALLNSEEDPFTVAFFYSKYFDVLEYVVYLRNQEITNITYNVIKKYLKGSSREIIDAISITKSSQDLVSNLALRLMRGELYRTEGFSLSECLVTKISADSTRKTKVIDKYGFVGFTSVMEHYLDNLESSFEVAVKTTPEIIELLDCENPRVQALVRQHQDSLIDFIMSGNLLPDLFFYLDLSSLSYHTIAHCLSSVSSLLEKIQREQWLEKASKHLCKSLFSDSKTNDLLKVLIASASSYMIYSALSVPLFECICHDGKGNLKLDFEKPEFLDELRCFSTLSPSPPSITETKETETLLFIAMTIERYYHGHVPEFIREQMEKICKYFLSAINRSSNVLSISDEIQFLVNNQIPFHASTVAYFRFVSCEWDTIPRVEEVIRLPDKFMIFALERINTRISTIISDFHKNLHSSKMRSKIARAASQNPQDKEIFVRYLVAKGIWEDIEMEEYVDVMDDKYKMLYAENHIDWAVRHLDELRRIGFSKRLYTRLSRSEQAGLLIPEDKPKEAVTQLRNPVRVAEERDEFEDSNKLKNILPDCPVVLGKRTFFPDSTHNVITDTVDDDEECFDNTTEEQEATTKKIKVAAPSYGFSLQSDASEHISTAFESLKCPEFSPEALPGSLYSQLVKSYETYKVVMNTLFNWTKETKASENFLQFLAFSLSYCDYELPLADFRIFLDWYSSSEHFCSLLRSLASVICCTDLYTLVDSYYSSRNVDTRGSVRSALVQGLTHRAEKSRKSVTDFALDLAREKYNHSRTIIGLDLVYELSLADDELLIDKLVADHLSSSNDEVLSCVLKIIPAGMYSEKLLPIIFRRNVLDDLTAEIIKKIDMSRVEREDVSRIYSIFYAAPMMYLKHDLYNVGLPIDENMAIELITLLAETYDKALFTKIASAFDGNGKHYSFTHRCIGWIIEKLATLNSLYKAWALEKLEGVVLSAGWFIKVCWLVANETDYELIRKGIAVLKKGMPKERKMVEMVFMTWKQNPKLLRLVRRIYPLFVDNDKEGLETYKALLRGFDEEEEVRILCDLYKIEV